MRNDFGSLGVADLRGSTENRVIGSIKACIHQDSSFQYCEIDLNISNNDTIIYLFEKEKSKPIIELRRAPIDIHELFFLVNLEWDNQGECFPLIENMRKKFNNVEVICQISAIDSSQINIDFKFKKGRFLTNYQNQLFIREGVFLFNPIYPKFNNNVRLKFNEILKEYDFQFNELKP